MESVLGLVDSKPRGFFQDGSWGGRGVRAPSLRANFKTKGRSLEISHHTTQRKPEPEEPPRPSVRASHHLPDLPNPPKASLPHRPFFPRPPPTLPKPSKRRARAVLPGPPEHQNLARPLSKPSAYTNEKVLLLT